MDIIAEGHSKIIYQTPDNNRIEMYFKDTATAFHNIKRAKIIGKGQYVNKISAFLFQQLKAAGVKTEATFVPEGGHGMGMYSEENLQKMVSFLKEAVQ